ncbi:hypothetical protein [Streptomyces pactum]|nr:hypothetical protein [Streptomyces pactum]
MTIKRGRKGELGLEVLPLVHMALPEPDGQTLLRDRHPETMAAIGHALRASLDNISRLQGQQAQYAFEAVVVALGGVRLIKTEDSGSYYFDDADGELRPPDFRIILRDGTVLLVEVKLVPPGKEKKVKVRAKDMEATEAYARATGGRLLYAHYWSGPNLWTLVPPSAFQRDVGQQRLTVSAAMMANEMGILGDAFLGGKPPLTVSVLMDTGMEKSVEAEDESDQRLMTTAGVELSSAGKVIKDPAELKLAWFLAWHSGWIPTQRAQFDSLGRVARINYDFAPDVDKDQMREIAKQGFAFFGALSTLYTARFRRATTTDGGDIRALSEEPRPALMAQLVPEDYWEQDRILGLWKFNLKPQ